MTRRIALVLALWIAVGCAERRAIGRPDGHSSQQELTAVTDERRGSRRLCSVRKLAVRQVRNPLASHSTIRTSNGCHTR